MNKKACASLVIIIFVVLSSICAKIRLFTFQYNRPDFIETQYKCLKMFLKEKNDFELIVFNDAIDRTYKKQIEQTCQKLEIPCINFPQELHYKGILIKYLQNEPQAKKKVVGYNDGTNGSVRHCQILRYALDKFGYNHNDIVGIMDGDLFLIKNFSIREYLKDCDFIGSIREDRENRGLEYIWIGLSFFKIKNLPNPQTFNFDLTFVDGTLLDSGGNTYYYVKNNPNVKIKKYMRVPITELPRDNEQKLKQLGFGDSEIYFLKKSLNCRLIEDKYLSTEFHLDNHFLHYSWSSISGSLDDKSKLFKDFFNYILA